MENTQATNTNTTGATTQEENKTNPNSIFNDEYWNKVDGMLAKRMGGVLKSIVKDNGANDEEANDIVTQYKTRNDNKQKELETQLNALKSENEALKNSIYKTKLNESVSSLAEKMGFNPKYTEQIIKLADLNGINDNGKINGEKLEEAIKKVIEDCEAFKETKKAEKPEQPTGFKNIGAAAPQENVDAKKELAKKVMGIK